MVHWCSTIDTCRTLQHMPKQAQGADAVVSTFHDQGLEFETLKLHGLP